MRKIHTPSLKHPCTSTKTSLHQSPKKYDTRAPVSPRPWPGTRPVGCTHSPFGETGARRTVCRHTSWWCPTKTNTCTPSMSLTDHITSPCPPQRSPEPTVLAPTPARRSFRYRSYSFRLPAAADPRSVHFPPISEHFTRCSPIQPPGGRGHGLSPHTILSAPGAPLAPARTSISVQRPPATWRFLPV